MAEKTRAGRPDSPECCEVAWLRRRRELEQAPMTRVDTRECREACAPVPACPRGCGWETVAQALEEQNKLLCDILGAINCLTAAQLAQMKKD